MISTYSGTSCTTEISYSVHGSNVAQDGLLLNLELCPLSSSLSLMVGISICGDTPASNIHHYILMWKVTVYLCTCCSNLLHIYLFGLSPLRIFHCSSCNPTAWIHYSSHAYLKSRVSPTKQHTNTGGGNGVIITQAVKSEAQPTRHVSTHCTLSQSVQRRTALLLILELYPQSGSLSLIVGISICGDTPASNLHHHILMWKVTVYLCMCCSKLLYIYLFGLSPPRIFHCSSCNPTAWIHYSSHAYLKSRVSPTKQH